MEDKAKAAIKLAQPEGPGSTRNRDPADDSDVTSTFVAFMDDSPASGEAKPSPSGEPVTPTRALDRWFRERQKSHGQPRLLEIPNEALVMGAGPINLTGNITLVHEDGSIAYANHVSLCRCGASKTKPFCDGRHLDVEFLNIGRIEEISDTAHSERPTKITLSCVKDGPVTFRGRLRLHNSQGQQCVKQRGSLCRCGQSASKPFCDGSHERVGFRSGR